MSNGTDLLGALDNQQSQQQQPSDDPTGMNRAPGFEVDDANRAAKQERRDELIDRATESPIKTGGENPLLDAAAAEWAAKAGLGEAAETVADLRRDGDFMKDFSKGKPEAVARMQRATLRSVQTPQQPQQQQQADGPNTGDGTQQRNETTEAQNNDAAQADLARARNAVTSLGIAQGIEQDLAGMVLDQVRKADPQNPVPKIPPHQQQQIAEAAKTFANDVAAGVAMAGMPNDTLGQLTVALRSPDFNSDANMHASDTVEAEYVATLGDDGYRAALMAANDRIARSPKLWALAKQSDVWLNPQSLRTLVEWGRTLVAQG